ncbi:DMT family transporter [Chitinimonas koreensis]|uniref:DMT family transporter n=1 Tax=Chitinimonas koreensis TaxID=356302 RepID=UPI000424FED2|nr:DMT family transporter [Chitinimonas koreensis]QNM98514.1 EamA family transporter [Chitinimonas koreensis]
MQYLFPLLAVLIWAGNTVVNKLAAGVVYPAEIGFYRWLVAGLLFTPFMLGRVRAEWPAIRPLLPRIAVLGALGMAVYQSLAYYAAHRTSATNMGIILSLMPMMALALSIAVLGQRLTLGALAGAAVSFVGVLFVISGGEPASLLHHGVGSGDAMMLVATFAYAVYSVLLKKWQLKLAAPVLLYLQILVAIVLLSPLYLLSPKAGLNAANAPLVLYAGLLASMLAPLAWMRGVARLGPSRTTMFFNLSPLFTALIAATPILGERLGPHHLLGGLLILAGVLLTERWKTPLGRRAAA